MIGPIPTSRILIQRYSHRQQNVAFLPVSVVRIRAFLLFFLLWWNVDHVVAQTDFAPGQIMFTGYDSDNPDAFSFVILTDVVSGTVIYITDRGWSSTTGFRDDGDGEGTLSFTFNAAYDCGTTVVFEDVGGANDWLARDIYGNTMGTVAILTSTTESPAQDPDGVEFNVGGFPFPDGDQLFIYQLPEPNPGNQTAFVTGIHMNGGAWNGNNSDDYSSMQPTGLLNNQVVRFNTEVDNAKYDCSPNTASATTLQAAITNDNGSGGLVADGSNNWAESNTFIDLFPACNFCCGTIPPVVAPVITAPYAANTNQVFTINITGTLAAGEQWELYTAGCGIGTPLQTTTTSSFSVTAPAVEGIVLYYVRTSEEADCGALCATVEVGVCTNVNNMNICTDCSADPQVCGDCFLSPIGDNPDLDSGCFAIKLIFVLDESGSIGGNAPDVEAGVLAFLNALNGQGMEAALIEFSSLGRLVNDYTPINNSYIMNIENYFNGIPYNGHTYSPAGGTNWHDAMVRVDALASADIVMFFTDGIPTVWSNPMLDCGNGSTTQTPEIVNPVKLANKIKSEGTHMFMLGVGMVTAPNLQLMSGTTVYQSGVNTLGTSDYALGNFQDLANDLEDFVTELCVTPLDLDKQLLGAVCDGVQEFMFIIHNPGTESAATVINVIDTFPTGYNNIVYNGPPGIKLCIGAACAAQGQPQPDNAFIWTTNSLPPGESDTLILSVNVLPTGNYMNIAWAQGNNTALTSDTITGDTMNDDLSPLITCPPNISIECSDSSLPPGSGLPTATDPDGSDPDLTFADVIISGTCANEFTITRTWTATDGCNNTATCIQTIMVDDTTPPNISCPANVTIQCTASTLPANTGSVTGMDNCDSTVSISFANIIIAGSCPASYTIHRTWTALDNCGNSNTCMQSIFIEDSVIPSITCPSNVTISCTANTLPANTGSPTGTDNCDTSPTITYTDVSSGGTCPQEYTIIRTWKAQDDCGNINTCNQTITIDDSSPPALTCPANVTIQCTASTLPANTGVPTTSDNCDLTLSITFSNVITSGGCPQEFIITRTWIATDDCGNSSTCNQIISVEDNTAPVILCPPNITIQCTASTVPSNTGTATANDNCGPVLSVTFADISVSGTCAQEYTITRTWTATDACANSSTCTQTIFIDDSLGPVITCPPNITIQCTDVILPANTGMATSTDNCNSSPTVTFSDVSVGGICPQEYTISRTWVSTDACGNSNSCVQVIFIDDSTSPVITCPVNITIECTAVTLPANTGTATSSDNCDPSPSLSFSDIITGGTCPQEYVITRRWQATDDCGNSSTCNQIIVVDDSTIPMISCPGNITIECTSSTLPLTTGTATGTDNCDTSPSISYNDSNASGLCPQQFTITRTWTVVDDCGNSSTCNQIISIQDTAPPNIICPGNITIECTANPLPANTGTPATSDNCDIAPVLSFSDSSVSGSCPNEYTITRTWMSTDDCGNTSLCTQLIFIEDNTSPEITCPVNVTIECTASTLPSNTGLPMITDNCDLSPAFTYSDVITAGTCAQENTIARTWTSMDTCGNTNVCIQLITLQDIVPPVITCPANVTIQCIENTLPDSTGMPVIVDNCDMGQEIEFTDVTVAGPTPNGYTIQRTWVTTDECGNSSSCLQIIIVENPIDPEITGFTFDTICSGGIISYTAEDQGLGPATYNWTFGSGSSPSSANGIGPHTVQYTYNATNGSTGANTILTVTIAGCASVTDTVANTHVNAIPNPAINGAMGNLCYFRLDTFVPAAPQMAGFTYEWNFGNGASIPSITGYGPHYVEYDTIGQKIVRLIVFSNEAGASCGDTGTISFMVVVCNGNVTGRVRKPDGSGIGSVIVRIHRDNDLNGLPDGPFVKSVLTTGSGSYTLTDLVPGHYVIKQNDLPGYFSLYDADETEDGDAVQNNDPNDNLIPATIAPQTIDADNIFVDVTSPGIASGYVFEDFDMDGMPDTGEGIGGVQIKLFPDVDQNGIADPGNPLATTLTSAIGYFTFGNMTNGDYVITETQPANYDNVQDIDQSNDSDVVPNTNTTDDIIPVTISNGETDANNYFKESSTCSQVVTNTNDSGPGSLRYAINCAASGDTIAFHSALYNQVIHLNSDRIIFNKDIYLHSDVNPRVRIQSDISGAFKINSGFYVEFKNINFTSGLSGTLGATFENYGQLVLWDAYLYRNALLLSGNYLIYNSVPGIMTAKGVIQIEVE